MEKKNSGKDRKPDISSSWVRGFVRFERFVRFVEFVEFVEFGICVLWRAGGVQELSDPARYSRISFGCGDGIHVAVFGGMHRYQDFTAWQLTGELNQIIFQLTSEPPACHDFKFRDNLRDAADSAQRNFPEGFGRFAPGDFAHFLDHSRASLLEVNNELAVGLDRGYFRAEDVEAATLLVKRALKALSGLQRYLRSPEAKLNAKRARAAHIARRDSNKRT